MTCHEFWAEMPELTGESKPLDHVRECPSCAALLERQRALSAALGSMAKGLASRQASPALEARLVAAFRSQTGKRAAPFRPFWLAWIAAAALIVVSIVSGVGRKSERAARPGFPAMGGQILADLTELDSDFIPLPYGGADLPAANADDPDLVHVEVPRSALIALGLPMAEEGSARVEAVVALGADGVVQGIQVME